MQVFFSECDRRQKSGPIEVRAESCCFGLEKSSAAGPNAWLRLTLFDKPVTKVVVEFRWHYREHGSQSIIEMTGVRWAETALMKYSSLIFTANLRCSYWNVSPALIETFGIISINNTYYQNLIVFWVFESFEFNFWVTYPFNCLDF